MPHDWSIEGTIEQHNPTGPAGGYLPAGIGWYRKTFQVPPSWKGQHVVVYFEGVYANATVFLNGDSVGMHPYGYTSFFLDLTPHVRFDARNIIAVRVDNSRQVNCRWYSGSGIYRPVRLLVTGPVHLRQWGTAVTADIIDREHAEVHVETRIMNESSVAKKIRVSTRIVGKTQATSAQQATRIELAPLAEKTVVQSIPIRDPLLWSPDEPNLYEAEISLQEGTRLIDRSSQRFGIRSLRVSATEGFQLNGTTVKMNGGCVHHDNGCLGAAAYPRAEERRVELLKLAGFNTVRTSHNPPSEAFLDACDRLGMMVIDEAFDGWRQSKTPSDYSTVFDAWWQRDLESMVLRDRNHPSVVMWSIGNEIIERKKPEAIETAKALAALIHRIDHTRPVTSAMTTWDNDWEIFDPLMAAHDVCGYNYQMHRAPADHQRVPSRIILQTESYPKDAYANWRMVQMNPYIIGDVVWTAIDYLGESGIGRYYYPGEPKGEHWEVESYPWHGAYCGDIDLTGWRKPISHYRNIIWNNTENLFMGVREPNPDNGEIKTTMWAVWPTWSSWTWPGDEGKEISVEVYSKYPAVRLYVNDSLVGEQPTSQLQEYKATFTLPYVPGVLRAAGIQNHAEVESTTLKTAGRSAKIRLVADRSELLADGQDLSFVAVEITDTDGTIQPNADNRIQFTVNGPAVIAGVDNANPRDTASSIASHRNAWHGRAMVVVRTTHTSGRIVLEASSPGLEGVSVNLEAKERP